MLPSNSIKWHKFVLMLLHLLLVNKIHNAEAKASPQLPNEQQTYQPNTYNKEYQPRYNPLYTNTQQPPQSNYFENNPQLPSLQDIQTQQGTQGGLLGASNPNYNAFPDQNRQFNGGIGGQYDPFNRGTGTSSSGIGYLDTYSDEQNFCPEHWVAFRQTCYRFIKSPKRNWLEAKKICKAYSAELVNIDNIDKHSFILKELIIQNQRQNRFWVSARQVGPNSWTNDDNSQFLMLEDSFSFEEQAIENEDLHDNRFLVQDNLGQGFSNNRNNPNQYYNTITGSATNRNRNNLQGFIGNIYFGYLRYN